MIKQVVIGIVIFYCGTLVGRVVRTNLIDAKISRMEYLARELKNRNNQLVDNIARVHAMTKRNSSEFDEIDEMLMNMWMN